ncbi:hypothetical protein CMI37_08985 [Candidatus Pacearchaeota archaeon]|nr:hypothetical protein [Candidatus Pacearchaeota archaeon]
MLSSIELEEFPVPVYEWEAVARGKDGSHFGVRVRLRAPSPEIAERLAHEAAVRKWKDCTFMGGMLVKYKIRGDTA